MRQILVCTVLMLLTSGLAWAEEPAVAVPEAPTPLFLGEATPVLAAAELATASPLVPADTTTCSICRCSTTDTGAQGYCVQGGGPCLECDAGETVHIESCECVESQICPAPPIPLCSPFTCQPVLALSCS